MVNSSENRIDTPMLAISDLDWDNFRAIDIFNILYSLNSNLLTVAIYKTKYGKEIENNTIENVYDKKAIVEYYKQKNKCYKAIATFKTSDDVLKTYNLADNLEIEDTLNFLNISFFNGNIPSDNIPVDSASNLEGYEHVNIPESQIYKPREIIIDIDQKRENFMEMVKHKEEYTVEFANDLICMSDDEMDNNKYKELLQYNESKNSNESKSSDEEDITEDDDMEKRKINNNEKKDKTEHNISEKRKIKNSDKKDKTENNNLKKKKHNIPEEESSSDFLKELEKNAILKKNKKIEINAKRKVHNKKKEENDDGFKLNLNDNRFNKLFTSKDYLIDKSHSLYKNNKAAEEIVKEKKKRNKNE